jgi:hypothetical protein
MQNHSHNDGFPGISSNCTNRRYKEVEAERQPYVFLVTSPDATSLIRMFSHSLKGIELSTVIDERQRSRIIIALVYVLVNFVLSWHGHFCVLKSHVLMQNPEKKPTIHFSRLPCPITIT